MKRRTKFVRLFCLISLGGILGGALLRGVDGVEALDYQSNVGVGFTFNPSLNVTLSNEDLVINGLAPGTAARDSNIIDVNVSTNVAYGCNLSATVGNSSNATQNLVNGDYSFTPLSASVAGLANFGNNEWGYSYSIDNGTNWINGDYSSATAGYGVLPLYTATGVKLAGNSDNAGSSVQFKIAAKAGATQASGEYTNVINFAAVANVIPATLYDAFSTSGAEMVNGYYKMQDMTSSICNAAEGESWLQLVDIRDNKLYWVAKLKDNNCWMTQNLDLDLSSAVALNSVTSDIDPAAYNTGIYTQANGYSKDDATGVVSWLPSTIVDVGGTPTQRADTIVMNGDSVPNWANDYNRPYSADPGERYRYTNPSSYAENTYTSLETCANNNNNDTVGCQHSHFGNYYNWSAAVANNNTSGYNSGTLTNSVCPKNWDLPVNGAYGTLMTAQEVFSSGNSYAADGFNKLRTAPLYYQRFGGVNGGSLINLGSRGYYWSSTVNNAYGAYGLNFGDSNIWPSYYYDRGLGFSVRCVVGT